MEFRILGPLEVHDGERSLGGGRQRALLAILLLHAGETVSRDRLIDGLWGERPPATAHKALQVHVSQLRKLLGPGVIVTRPPGYAIAVGPDELDLLRFEALLDGGRRARREGDEAAAAGLLREALALWRGPALSDVAYERFAPAEAARLEELRLEALEERLEADLALGRHAEVIGELERLIAHEPMRERPRGQLMLALYRSGRQADALEAYRAARRALVDELGVEPGARLRELEAAILAQDLALEAPAAAPRAAAEEGPPAEERKTATVLTVEVAGAERDPERVRARDERIRALVAETVEPAGGRIDPASGGSVRATFGAPAAQEDHAERALHAALAVRSRLHDAPGRPLDPRIGVETGEVLSGAAVAGAPVGESARLAGVAAAGEILVGAGAAAAARGAFELRPRAGAQALVGALAGMRPRGVRGLRRVFVGRREELDLLAATAERVARRGRPHLVTIMGEVGVGKTSLVGALRERLGPQAIGWHAGRCPAYGHGITYRPLAEALGSGGEDAVREQLERRPILGLALGRPTTEALTPWEARERLQDAWLEVLGEQAAEGPAILVVEDVHWADEPLLSLLETAARRVEGPLLLLATARPELVSRRPDWGTGRGDASRLWLEPLSADELRHMVEQLAGDLPTVVRDLVVDRAEGNPFFAEEVLQSLLDRGALRREGDEWTVSAPVLDVPLPDTVRAVLAARIDLLPAADKEALQAGAVAGRTFPAGAVRALTGTRDLDLLEDRDFLRRSARPSPAGEREYSFKHALTREVAYASLPAPRRARLHAGVAEWMEATRDGDERAGALAHHYAAAVDPEHADLVWAGEEERAASLRERALHWLRRAADLAFRRFTMDEAVALNRRALALEPDPGARSALCRAAARASFLKYETDAYADGMREALELAPSPAAAAELYAELAFEGARPFLWLRPPPRSQVEEWLEQALALAEPGSRTRAMALHARALLDPATGAAAADEGLALARRLEDPDLLVDAHEAQFVVATAAGRYAEAAA